MRFYPNLPMIINMPQLYCDDRKHTKAVIKVQGDHIAVHKKPALLLNIILMVRGYCS